MLLKLHPRCQFRESEEEVIVEDLKTRFVWKGLSSPLAECMRRLRIGARERDLEDLSKLELPLFYHLLEKLKSKSFVTYSVEGLATLQPLTSDFQFQECDVKDKRFFLSSFCFTRMQEGEML